MSEPDQPETILDTVRDSYGDGFEDIWERDSQRLGLALSLLAFVFGITFVMLGVSIVLPDSSSLRIVLAVGFLGVLIVHLFSFAKFLQVMASAIRNFDETALYLAVVIARAIEELKIKFKNAT